MRSACAESRAVVRSLMGYQASASAVRLGRRSFVAETANSSRRPRAPLFEFNEENFRSPTLPHGLDIIDLPLVEASEEALRGLGRLISCPDEITVGHGFEIVKWPTSGWRPLDPNTGDEAGTTEGHFHVWWQGDFFMARNDAVNTTNNMYLDGLGRPPEDASSVSSQSYPTHIHLWMSDYHPDGGQLFWPDKPIPFIVCLGPASKGDNITPADMCAIRVPPGRGVYIHPGTWHNGVYVEPSHAPARFLTRQGRVHARVSASWASEFNSLIRVPLQAVKE